jgi:putative transposase
MAKHLTKTQWIHIADLACEYGYKYAVENYRVLTSSKARYDTIQRAIHKAIIFIDNNLMNELSKKRGAGKHKKRDDSDIPAIIDELNEEEKREIIEHWIKERRDKRDKRDKNSLDSYSKIRFRMKFKILKMHRTTFYKKPVKRKYKYDIYQDKVTTIFHENMGIYGSRRLIVLLEKEGIFLCDRTLRHYLKRWNLITKTHRKYNRAGQKCTSAPSVDLVKRNFNPIEDNYIATDVSYIPANVAGNHIYLSAAINLKTKMIESWEVSKNNDENLVLRTIIKMNRTNFILHSDHGAQYSSKLVQNKLRELNSITSMGRVGNSLDNREIEYFFGCLKGEYLKQLKTAKMDFEAVKKHVDFYINWHNNKRIQKRLNWKAPAYTGATIAF